MKELSVRATFYEEPMDPLRGPWLDIAVMDSMNDILVIHHRIDESELLTESIFDIVWDALGKSFKDELRKKVALK